MTALKKQLHEISLPIAPKETPFFLETIFDQSAEPMVFTNAVDKIVAVNPAFTHVFGYENKDVKGKTTELLHSGRQPMKESYAAFMEGLHKDGYWRGDVWTRRKNGSIVVLDARFSGVYDSYGRLIYYVGIYSTIEQYEDKITTVAYDANRDALTSLPNQRLFMERLEYALKKIQRDCSVLSVIYINIDRFSAINEKFGFFEGDMVLKKLGLILQKCTRSSDTVARVGWDEFAILALDTHNKSNIDVIIQRILETIKTPKIFGENVKKITLSIGISAYPLSGEDAETVFTSAVEAATKARAEDGTCVMYAHHTEDHK